MDTILLLSRLQFAVTTIFHYFFVPLTLGLVIFVASLETAYVITKKEKYKKMTKFWGNMFIINFIIGVVTGIVQEFQFGMNWAEYSRFVGDIFGIPLAIEALTAFFLESTFIGFWLYSWDKVSPKVHVVAIWLVALGTNLSSIWIMAANAWMQNPVGFEIVNGRAQLVDFAAIISNSQMWHSFIHLITSAYATSAFFILGISSYYLIKNKDGKSIDMFKQTFKLGGIIALFTTLATIGAGHSSAQNMAKVHPMKLAAVEGLWKTENPAGFSILAMFDEANKKDIFNIKIPYLLSLLVYDKPEGEVKGINELEKDLVAKYGEGDYVPPVSVSYIAFRMMVGIGTLMLILSIIAIYQSRKKQLSDLFLKILIPFTFFPFIAGASGWIVTESGRYPWTVYGIMRLKDSVTSSMTLTGIIISFVVFTLVYLFATVVEISLIRRFAKKGIEE